MAIRIFISHPSTFAIASFITHVAIRLDDNDSFTLTQKRHSPGEWKIEKGREKKVSTILFNSQFKGRASFVSLFNLIVRSLELSFRMRALSYLNLMFFFRVPLNLTIFFATSYGKFDFVLIAFENGVITKQKEKRT